MKKQFIIGMLMYIGSFLVFPLSKAYETPILALSVFFLRPIGFVMWIRAFGLFMQKYTDTQMKMCQTIGGIVLVVGGVLLDILAARADMWIIELFACIMWPAGIVIAVTALMHRK
jgi:Ni,Fe-hydrogenase I cytochrome b subunit